MLKTRVIPTLLLHDQSLVKTTKFNQFVYVGDPCNTVRIFNELEVDELLFLDISATKNNQGPDYRVLEDIATECFMPLAYGGGISNLEQAKKMFEIGFEKIVLNSHAIKNPDLVTIIADYFGSQAVVVSIDYRKDLFGRNKVASHGGKHLTKHDPIEWAMVMAKMGAGELLVTSIDHEGTWNGFDVNITQSISRNVNIPVIAHGGAGNIEHIRTIIDEGGASAVGVGNMVVFQKKGMGVLVNFPEILRTVD